MTAVSTDKVREIVGRLPTTRDEDWKYTDLAPAREISVRWLDAYGLNFQGGRAQAFTFDSEKLHDFIQSTGEYALEAWVVPANVSQEDANIISYSGSDTARNFTLGQDLYNYDFYNRIVSTPPRPNGTPFLSSGQNDEEIAEAYENNEIT